MSSAVIATTAAQGRPFAFDSEEAPEVCLLSAGDNQGPATIKEAFPALRSNPSTIKNPPSRIPPAGVTSASQLAVRPAPEMVSSGIAAMDALTGGLPRGCLTEICGPASSGRTTLLLSAVAAATRRGEFCALVDAGDTLDPQSAAAAGIELERFLWVRCGEHSDHTGHRHPEHGRVEHDRVEHSRVEHGYVENGHAEQSLEQLLRVADLLLESGGFGLIVLDLGDLPPQTARRIPLTTWFRFRRAVEHTPTVLLAIERQSIAGSCSSLLLKLAPQCHRIEPAMDSQLPTPTHAQLLTELEITAEVVRSRMDRKPVRSAEATFSSKTAWPG
jgi:RecA DNA recombination protein